MKNPDAIQGLLDSLITHQATIITQLRAKVAVLESDADNAKKLAAEPTPLRSIVKPLPPEAAAECAAIAARLDAQAAERAAAKEIKRLSAEVARLTESLDAAHAKELAATFKTLAPTVHIAPAETVSNEPMTAKALAAAMALPAEKTFDDKLKGRTDWLGVRIEHALSAAKGLDSKNVVVRLQAESDATQKVADAFDGGGFDTVDVRRVYLSGGDYYAALAVPAGCAPVEYCMVVQALTGYKLRCIPASTGGVVVNVNAASLDLTDWSPAAKAAALAALKPYGTSRA